MDGQGSRKLFEQVINLLKNGSESEAENLCRSQLAEYPRDVNFLSLLGSISLRKNDFAMAEKSLKTVAEIAPGYPRVQEDLGTVLLNMGRPQEAILHLQKAIEQKILSKDCPIISLACAHPAKFPQVIKKSIGIIPDFPLHLDQIMSRKENFKTIDPNLKDVQEYIKKSMRKS